MTSGGALPTFARFVLRAAAFALVLLAAVPAAAQTFLRLQSEPGDYVGGGLGATYTAADGTFTMSGSASGIQFSITNFTGSTSLWWYALLSAPTGGTLAVGDYPLAERFSTPARAGLDVFGMGRGCNMVTGRFTVYEFVMVGGAVQKFAADFEQHCEGGSPALFGNIRYNSAVPLVPPYPIASATAPRNVEAGATVQLNGSSSRDPAGTALTFAWSQVSGPAVTIASPTSAIASFVAPAVPLGGADLGFRVSVTNAAAQTRTADVTVHVANAADPKTFIYFRSDPGDYIGGGQTRMYTPDDGRFTASANYGDILRGVGVSFDGSDWWTANFAPPYGSPLERGLYPIAERFPFQSPTHAGLSFSGTGRGCNTLTGSFTVHEIVVSGGTVQSFAADFVQHCEGGTPALHGVVRFNSTVPLLPLDPVASAVASRYVDAGANVVLDGSRSYDPNNSALTYAWSQVSGPPVALNSANAAVASFVAPAVPLGGADLEFDLTVTNGAARSSSDRVTLRVLNAADPRTVFWFKSEAGDYIGQGQTRTFTPEDGLFSVQPNYGDFTRGVTLNFSGVDYWSVDLAAPNGVPLAPGEYPAAERFPFQSPTRAGLDVSGAGRGCNQLTGRFTVYEIVVVNQVVQSLAADFEQHCEGASPALVGGVRFNSTVPVKPPNPIASATTQQYADPGQQVTLNGSGSRDPNGTALTYAWSQVSGVAVTLAAPNSAIATFTAPAVPLGGSDLVFELRVTNAAANSATARVTVHVANAADPKTFFYYKSEAGDWAGGGQTRTLTLQDAVFAIAPNYSDYTRGIQVSIQSGSLDSWTLNFAAPNGVPLAAGDYLDAERFPFQSPTRPGLSATGGGCNTLTGRFTVYEMVMSNGVVQSFAADFEQHCEGASPALFGSIRYRSTVPLKPLNPIASARAPAEVDVAATVTLDGSTSRDPNGTAITYAWSQVSGPQVTLASPASAVTTFLAPYVPPGGADLVFELRVTNAAGSFATTRVMVHVANAVDPRTLIYIQSDPGDYIGGGVTRTYKRQDGTFTAQPNYGDFSRGVSVDFDGGSTWWTAAFAAPSGLLLTPGEYLFAERFPFQAASKPGLSFYGTGRGCNTLTGKFTVLEYVVANGALQRFAVDFEQHCEGGAPALRGSVRFNSAVPYAGSPPGDTPPAFFRFVDQNGVEPGSLATSNPVTITGLIAPTQVRVEGGSYSIGCNGTFTTADGSITPGQSVCVRHVAPMALGATTTTALTVGGVSGMFRSTTLTTLPANEDWDGDLIPNGMEIWAGSNPLVRDNNVMGVGRLFAMQQYRDFLGREGDPAGIQFYENLLATGASDRAAMVEAFFNSPEFSGTVSPIVRLYFATFLRVPDYDGLLYQVNALRTGASLEAIATNFTLSPEFQARYGSLGNAAFVALLYQNILGRTASQPEIDFHVARLAAGVSRGAVLTGFSESPEFRQLAGPDVYVTMMYVGMLRRAPEQAGFDFWVQYIEQGNSGLALINGFLNSQEYRGRFQ